VLDHRRRNVDILLYFRSIHETQLVLPAPAKIPTPYGGQLAWTLPGGNLLYVHIKDKNKIRHKKRWSQVTCTQSLSTSRTGVHWKSSSRHRGSLSDISVSWDDLRSTVAYTSH